MAFGDHKQETEALSATSHKGLNSDNHYTSLKADPPPVEPWEETTALNDNLVVVFQETQLNYAQILDPQKLWDNRFIVVSH